MCFNFLISCPFVFCYIVACLFLDGGKGNEVKYSSTTCSLGVPQVDRGMMAQILSKNCVKVDEAWHRDIHYMKVVGSD